MSYSIRPSIPADLRNIHEVYHRAAQAPVGLLRRQDEITRDYVQYNLDHSLDTGITLVAENYDGRILGEIHAWPSPARQLEHCLGNLSLAVDPAAQNRGIGTALFSELIAAARRNPKLRIIELFCREDNVRAVALYQKLGFVFEGRLKGRVWQGEGKPYLDDLLMALHLTADA